MNRWVAMLAGAVSLVAFARAAEPQPIPAGLGVNIHFTDAKPGEMEMIRDAGMSIVRMDMVWSAIEKTKGVYDFSRYDRLVKSLEANGVKALFILDYGNSLYDQDLSPHTDEGRAAFASFAAAAVQRYAGKGILWEIWNEPNIGQFWKPQPKVEDYVKLALSAGKAMRVAAPDEKIIGPTSSTIDLPFLEACFKGGALEYFDAISVHPYRGSNPETVTDEYRKLRRLIAQHAPAGKQIPILSGEWGYASVSPNIDTDLQGKYLARQWLTNLSSDIPLSIWYDWRNDGTDPKDAEQNFGTVLNEFRAEENPPYRPKPAYVAAQWLTRELKGYRFNKRLALERESDWLLLFQNGESVKLVAWTTDLQPRKVKLPISEGSFAITSHLGASLGTVKANEGALEVELSDGPIYLGAQGANAWLTLLANWSRLEDVPAFRAPGPTTIATTLRNTTDAPLTLQTEAGSIVVQPGESHKLVEQWYLSRTPYFLRAKSVLQVAGHPSVRQYAYIGVLNPLAVEIQSAMAGQIAAVVENPTGEAMRGQVSIGAGEPRPIVFAAGETKQTVEFPTPANEGPYTVHLMIKDGDKLLLDLPARKYVPMALDTQQLKAFPDGDPAIKSDLSLEPAPASAMELTYRFDEGWKFARIATAQPLPIEGQPLSIGMWVQGDNSGNLLRIRFVDSTGQTFQPSGFTLDFDGRRYLEFSLSGDAAPHWGGPNDGVVHYPIRLDTLLLVDSAKRKATAGKVQVSGPVLIYPAD